MFSSAFIKTDKINKRYSKTEETKTNPEEGIGDDEYDNKIDKPEKSGNKINNPEEGIIDIIDL